MNFRSTFPALLSLALTAGPARAADWPDFGAAPARSRLSAESTGTSFGPASAWQHLLDDEDHAQPSYKSLLASPSVADGFLAFVTQRNTVRLLRETDGRLLWEAKIGGSFYASPAIWRGRVFVMGLNQELSALHVSDGTLAWKVNLGAGGWASPLVVDDSVFVASADPTSRIVRLDARTGQIQWQAGDSLLRQAVLASLAVADGKVIAAEAGGRVHSFAVEDGRPGWTVQLPGTVNLASPLVAGGRIHVITGGDKAQLFALDGATGAIAEGWPLELPTANHGDGLRLSREILASSPAGTADMLVFSLRTDDNVDMDGNGTADRYVSQETLVAVNAVTRQVRWTMPNGRLQVSNVDDRPTHGFVPSPALFRDDDGDLLAAATSSVSARLRVISLGDGTERWAGNLSGTSRSSPLFANGRLVVGTDRGVIHSFLSRYNRPPVAPDGSLAPAEGSEVERSPLELSWGRGIDPESQRLRYLVRLDDDGEILRDWDRQLSDVTTTSVKVSGLAPGQVYTFAVRAQDPAGAWSGWSRTVSFRTLDTPEVTVDGRPVAGLTEAVGLARPGQLIRLGAGTFPLPATLRLPAGATLQGAGPHLTTLRARNLPVAVAPGPGSGLRHLTVTGAEVGVDVDGAQGVRLQNVILRDNTEAGLRVALNGSAEVINVTAARNGTGLRLDGSTHVRNTLVWGNDVGVQLLAPVLLDSRYNNVFGNRVEDWRNGKPGEHDLAQPVAFEAPGAADQDGDGGLRLKPGQPTTDRGDPTEEYAEEPAPNGGRINIGAFGNTQFAELSGTPPAEPGSPPVTQPQPIEPTEPPPIGRASGGGGLCALSVPGSDRPDGALLLVLGALLLVRRRR